MRAAVYRGPRDIRIESVAEPADPCGARRRDPGGAGRHLRHRFLGVGARTAPGPAPGGPGPRVRRPGRRRRARGRRAASVGDRVVCGAGISCGECDWCRAGRTNLCAHYRTIGLHVDGGLAEYVSSPAGICLAVPDALTDDAAAIAQPLAVALHAVRRSRLRRRPVVRRHRRRRHRSVHRCRGRRGRRRAADRAGHRRGPSGHRAHARCGDRSSTRAAASWMR